MTVNKYFWSAIAFGFCVYAGSVGAAVPKYPLEEFARLPQYSNPTVSPDGQLIAATVVINGKPIIYIKNRQQPDKVYPPIQTQGMYFSGYYWVNNERLIVNLRTSAKFGKILYNYQRPVSVKYTGEEAIGLEMKPNKWGYFLPFPQFVGIDQDNPNTLLMTLDSEEGRWGSPVVHSVDVVTGKRKQIQSNDRDIQNWLADYNGVVRIGSRLNQKNNEFSIIYRRKEGAAWETLQKVSYFEHDRLRPLRFLKEDPNILLVTTRQLEDTQENNLDGSAYKIYRYNLSTRSIEGEHIDKDYDVAKASVEKAMPNVKVDIVSMDKSKRVSIVKTYSDNKSPMYFVLDRNTKTLDFLGSEYPALENATLAKMNNTEYPARDGAKIPAYVTLPEGSSGKNLPFVIYVHGGPWARDYWGFDNYVQYFANKGYGVLQPQFRGSTGFGSKHEEAGYGQWGRLIQDDITDGVKWLIAEGVADPKRICIVGSSFGGYAAAQGLVKTPDLYKCGISVNGVLNLEKLYSDMGHLYFKNLVRKLFNDEDNLKPDSPFHNIASIKSPLLLVASEKDTVVPVDHSRTMNTKMSEQGKSVNYIELPGGEHWRTSETQELAIFKAMDVFLTQHLGG